MRITFDPAKDASNQAKHGVSLGLATQLAWDELLCRPDTRRDYGELREIGYAPIGDRLFCVVFVQRAREWRVVSLRKANRREVIDYVRHDQDQNR